MFNYLTNSSGFTRITAGLLCEPRPGVRPYVCFRGCYWEQSGHELLHRKCLLLTQSGHPGPFRPLPGS